MDALPVLCSDKNYRYIDNIVFTQIDLRKAAFLPAYTDLALWSDTYNMEINTVNPTTPPDTQTGEHFVIISMVERIHVFNTNLRK